MANLTPEQQQIINAAKANVMFEEKSKKETIPETLKQEVCFDPPVEKEDTSGKKEYAEIIGSPHPDGNKYYFTTYEKTDWSALCQSRIPEVNENFVIVDKVDHDYALAVLLCLENDLSGQSFGSAGTGKTTLPMWICSKINYPCVYVQGQNGAEPSDYLGQVVLIDEQTIWKDGELTSVVKEGGLLIFDEFERNPARTNVFLHSLLDDRRTIKLQGHNDAKEVEVKANPKFRIWLTGNASGVTSDTTKYSSEEQDNAFINRVALKIEVPQPSSDKLHTILSRAHPTIGEELLKKAIQLFGSVNTLVESGEIKAEFTIRTINNWLSLASKQTNYKTALNLTFTNVLDSESKGALTGALKDIGLED